jgi:aspartokinase
MSISRIVEQLINDRPFISEALTEDLINVSALARKLQPEICKILNKEINEGAIIMAIKRLSPGLYKRVNIKITHVIGDIGELVVRKNLSEFTFSNSDQLFEKQTTLMHRLKSEAPEFLTISRGINETTIITNDKYSKVVSALFNEEDLKTNHKEVAAITIKLPSVKSDVYGFFYYILKHLAWYGINIIEIVSTSHELSIVMNESDTEKALQVLNNLKKGD